MEVGVTGSSGFLGSHLTNALHQKTKFQVTTLKRNSSKKFPSINELKSFVENLDLIYHVAGVNRGTNEEIFEGNIQATFNLLEAIRKYGNSSPRIIFTSSSQVYKEMKSPKELVTESYKADPATLFGVAKKTAEDLIRLSGFEHAIIRIANIYGPGCRPEYNSVIATFCHKSVNGEPLRVDGDGHQERDFIYVEDVINAMVLAGIKVNNFISGVYNIGTNRTASLRHIIQSIKSSGVEIKESYSPNASIGQNSFSLDATYFRQQFKWAPETTLQSGIKKTLHSFQKEVTL
ncbi:MAG TPA: NAD(P)-dependent oxidoreductase [Nitrospinaceae bacterium]|jgi:nucleoside-diphosphate-sugar epimerase|nr:NAD(P)-dependent oxidoreductase [Nitrospinaceae bacterium]HIL26001.1 NAD(P)-dependent oxidoreductase [Nitrospinaceae bacterium]